MKKQILFLSSLLMIGAGLTFECRGIEGLMRYYKNRTIISNHQLGAEGDSELRLIKKIDHLPTVLREYVLQFLSDTYVASPAPSLRRVRVIQPKTFNKQDKEEILRLQGVNNKGDLFYGHEDDCDERGQRIIFQKNDADQKHVYGYLKDNWKLFTRPNPHFNNGIPLCRSETGSEQFLLGRYDVESQSIVSIGDCQRKEKIYAMNLQAAIVGNKKSLSLLRESQRLPIPRADNVEFSNDVSIDLYSHSIAWSTHSMLENYQCFIKDFDKSEEPLCLTKFQRLYPDSRQRGNVIVQSGILNNGSGDLEARNELYYYVKAQGWKHHLLDLPKKFSENVTIALVAINPLQSAVVCFIAEGNTHFKNPVVIVLRTGVIACDRLAEEAQDKEEVAGESSQMQIPLASTNGSWIAAQCNGSRKSSLGKVILWKVRGVDLDPKCTLEDRCYLNEFRQLYDKAKIKKAYIYLTADVWAKFQELSAKPDCEVPDAWRTRFKAPR